jgi:hypothetical protein
MYTSGSIISSIDLRPRFGLGDAADPGTAEIHWPSGVRETVKLPAVDRMYIVTVGRSITDALCSGARCAIQASAKGRSS